jgi:hypothetical protein
MILPANHLFKVIQGATFDFRFQFRYGPQASVVPVDLTDYTGTWTITSFDGLTTYASYTTGASPGQSGVFFGGDLSDHTTGIIDLVIVGNDTAALSWTTAAYTFSVALPSESPVPLLEGHIAVIGTLPS